MKKILILLVIMALISCNDEIEPDDNVRGIYDVLVYDGEHMGPNDIGGQVKISTNEIKLTIIEETRLNSTLQNAYRYPTVWTSGTTFNTNGVVGTVVFTDSVRATITIGDDTILVKKLQSL